MIALALILITWTATAQTNDDAYTARIREYTTEAYFLTSHGRQCFAEQGESRRPGPGRRVTSCE
jgi:hypothetical protein